MANQHRRLQSCLIAAGIAAIAIATAANAQRFGWGPDQHVAAGNPLDMLNLLARVDVRNELDLIGDQQQSLRKLNGESRRKLREGFAELRSGGIENARKRIRDLGAELRQELDQELDQILLPHQMVRLKQIGLQYRLRESVTFFSEAIAQHLGVAGEQRQELNDRRRELEIEFQHNVTSWRADTQRQLVALLTTDQQKKLKEFLGQPFRFVDQP
jgi:hypothetical protein